VRRTRRREERRGGVGGKRESISRLKKRKKLPEKKRMDSKKRNSRPSSIVHSTGSRREKGSILTMKKGETKRKELGINPFLWNHTNGGGGGGYHNCFRVWGEKGKKNRWREGKRSRYFIREEMKREDLWGRFRAMGAFNNRRKKKKKGISV